MDGGLPTPAMMRRSLHRVLPLVQDKARILVATKRFSNAQPVYVYMRFAKDAAGCNTYINYLPERRISVDIPDSALDAETAEPVDTMIPCVCQKLDNLAAMFDEKIMYDKQKENAFSKLYEELDMFKNDFVERRMKEVYTDLFLLYDNVTSYVQRDDVQASENEVACECLGYVIEEILEVLYRRGIERIIVDGDAFDPQLQRALRTEPAENPDCDGKVVKVIKTGFVKENAILRHETVVVARWKGEEGMGR